jgi:hypothetical protein
MNKTAIPARPAGGRNQPRNPSGLRYPPQSAIRNFGCPPLTPDDIFTLRGEPMAKRNNSSLMPVEEWIYYNVSNKTKECYRFKNGRLVNYKMEEAI